jgi:hypothetical protein
VAKAPGTPARELTWSELREKFIDCARHSRHVAEVSAIEAFEAIQKLEDSEDIAEVTRLLTGSDE